MYVVNRRGSTLTTMNSIDERWEETGGDALARRLSRTPGSRRHTLNSDQRSLRDVRQEHAAADPCIRLARVRSRMDAERLELALERVVERHHELGTPMQPAAKPSLQWSASRTSFQLDVVDTHRWGEAAFEEIVRLTSSQQMDLSAAVLRAVLFTRASEDHLLLLLGYGDAFDERGMDELIRDLEALHGGDIVATEEPAEPTREPAARRRGRGVREIRGSGAHRLFEDRAARRPDEPALTDLTDGRCMSYGELDREANRLARRLRDLGVDPRSCVAVDLPLSAATVVAHLAVLKVGAACAPCEPLTTEEKAAALLMMARPSALITSSSAGDSVTTLPRIVVELDAVGPRLHSLSDQPLGVVTHPTDAAVISLHPDKRPHQAIAITHDAVANLLGFLHRHLPLEASDRVLALGPLTARGLLLDVLLPLSCGAHLVLNGSWRDSEPEALRRTLADQAITMLNADPAQWDRLVASGWRAPSRLRALCDGRIMPAALLAELTRATAEVWNLYGFPETAFCSSAARVESGETSLRVGEPIDGARIHLLDPRLRPVPLGTPGILFIGGAAVARPYPPDASSTAGDFVVDPFSPEGRGFLFRTGDRARRVPDGGFELLRDAQAPEKR